MKKGKFYRQNQLIAVYDENDNLVTVCDNESEFAEAFDMDRSIAASTLSRLYKGTRSFFLENGKKRFAYFIPLEPQEIIDLKMIY